MSPRDGSALRPSVAERMPVLFVGHGSPMNVVEDNRWSRAFSALRDLVPRPEAIVAVSAHWFVDGTFVTGSPRPRTIHDFSGFPPALYEVDYPAPGQVELARRVCSLLGEKTVSLRNDWGLDHGTWSVLRWMYPEADIPVVQLSIDAGLSTDEHHRLGRDLRDLRNERTLILGSGNVVHNLRDALRQMQSESVQTPAWARRFDTAVAEALTRRDAAALMSLADTEDGRQSHPTRDHWLPLIYAFATTDDRDDVVFPIEGFDLGSLSMRAALFG